MVKADVVSGCISKCRHVPVVWSDSPAMQEWAFDHPRFVTFNEDGFVTVGSSSILVQNWSRLTRGHVMRRTLRSGDILSNVRIRADKVEYTIPLCAVVSSGVGWTILSTGGGLVNGVLI